MSRPIRPDEWEYGTPFRYDVTIWTEPPTASPDNPFVGVTEPNFISREQAERWIFAMIRETPFSTGGARIIRRDLRDGSEIEDSYDLTKYLTDYLQQLASNPLGD